MKKQKLRIAKRTLTCLLSAAMICSTALSTQIITVCAYEENELPTVPVDPPTFTYKTNDEGFFTITGRTGTDKNLVIPSEIDGTTVTQIANFAFSETDITSVYIPDTVDNIGACAFENCKDLVTVRLPDNIKYLNKEQMGGQFRDCSSLENINLPDTLESIGPFTFENCAKLSDITYPKALNSLGVEVFSGTAWMNSQPDGPIYINNIFVNCKGYVQENTTLDIRTGTRVIAAGAIPTTAGKENIVAINLPDGLLHIGINSLFDCIGVQKITIPDSVTTIEPHGVGYYFDNENNCFSVIPGFTIAGKTGSVAEQYANENNIPFEDPFTLINESVISTDTVRPGQSVKLTAKSKGGTAPLTYAFYFKRSVNTKWNKIGTEFGTKSTTSFTPTSEGEYDLRIAIKDAAGITEEKTFSLSVSDKEVLANNSYVNAEKVQIGDDIRITGAASGGEGGYKYAFYFKRSANTKWNLIGKEFGTNTYAITIPKAAAKYDMKAVVMDSQGNKAEKIFTVEAVEKLELTNISYATAEKVNVGKTVTIAGRFVGGTRPVTFEFFFKRASNTKWNKLSYGNEKHTYAKFTPTSAAEYDLKAVATDSNGVISEKTFRLVSQ